MDGRDLNHGAARGNQPMEALALAELGDGARGRVGGADLLNGFQVPADRVQFNLRPKSPQSNVVHALQCIQELLLRTVENHPGIDEFLALGAGGPRELWRNHTAS